MEYSTKVQCVRAGYHGTWGEFQKDNAPFIPDHELSRIEFELDTKGTVTHKAHTAGDFVIEVVK